MNNKYVINSIDAFINNPEAPVSLFSSEDYLDALTCWNKKYINHNNWDNIVRYAFENVFCSVSDILRYRFLSESVEPGDKKFAFSIEKNIDYNYDFSNTHKNLQFLQENVVGIIIANIHKTPSGKNVLYFNDIIIRPDCQGKGLATESLTEMLTEPKKYFYQDIDGISTRVNKDNKKSRSLFEHIGLIQAPDQKESSSILNLENSYDNIINKISKQP